MNTLSYLSLLNDIMDALEVLFPKATNLVKADTTTKIVTAVVAPQLASQTLDPTVVALHATLPTVVTAVQETKAAIAAAPAQ